MNLNQMQAKMKCLSTKKKQLKVENFLKTITNQNDPSYTCDSACLSYQGT